MVRALTKSRLTFHLSYTSMLKGLSRSTDNNSKAPVPLPYTPVTDRQKNQEATILGFIAEENLPYAIAPKLVELTKELATDKKALDTVSLSRTTAAYKMQFGLAKTFEEELINDLREKPFSLNIDEATSSNKLRVVSILVSYYNDKLQQVITRHLKSISVITVNAKTLYDCFVAIFDEFDLPWTNLLAILMDSCTVMRGSKTGLETRIRETKAPHLLDVDGDSCHHVHNSAKKLSAPFEYHLEGLVKDIFSDFKWSADLRENLHEICQILNIKYTEPRNYIPHRWLSIYDTSTDLSRMFPALILFYYGFLSKEDRQLYTSCVTSIYRDYNLSEEARQRIRELRSRCASKTGMTKEGKERKARIVKKLFHVVKVTRLHLSFYLSVMPLLQSYVKTFEMTEPLIHKLNDYQTELYSDILVCFIRPEAISRTSKISQVDVEKQDNLLPKKDMFLGTKAKSIIKNGSRGYSDPVVEKFLNTVQKAYIACAKQLQKSMPLDNKFLKCASAIDPVCHIRGHSETLSNLMMLPSLAKHVISEDKQDEYERNCRSYVSSTATLPPFPTTPSTRADKWWSNSTILQKFPVLAKMALSLLSCFHGPQVESSFSAMNQIIDPHSANTSIESFSAIQSVRYHLSSSGKTAVEFFKKADYKRDPVNSRLCQNFKQAWRLMKRKQDEQTATLDEQKTELKLSKEKAMSKRKFAEVSTASAKRARHDHAERIKRKVINTKNQVKAKPVKKKPANHGRVTDKSNSVSKDKTKIAEGELQEKSAKTKLSDSFQRKLLKYKYDK